MGNTTSKKITGELLKKEKYILIPIEESSKIINNLIMESKYVSNIDLEYVSCVINIDLDGKMFTSYYDDTKLYKSRKKSKYVNDVEKVILQQVKKHFPNNNCTVKYDEKVTSKAKFIYSVKL